LKRLSALVAGFLAVLLVAATFAAGELRAQGKPASIDASITRQVESVIARDPFLRAMQIRVETQDGVVSLSGFVRSVDDIVKAGALVRGVSGVSAVRNGLRVQNRPSQA
jgi:osmotically-inducible protein OsmY